MGECENVGDAVRFICLGSSCMSASTVIVLKSSEEGIDGG